MEVRVWWTFGFELRSLRPGPMASHTSVSKIKSRIQFGSIFSVGLLFLLASKAL